MTEKDQIEQIDDAHSERIWQPVVRLKSRNGPETVAFNYLDSHSAANMFAENEAAKFAAEEEAKPIAERRVVVGFGVRNIEAPAASQQQMRPVDSRLVNIDRLAEEIARTVAKMRQVSAAGYGLEAVEMKKEIFERVISEGVQLYREDCPLPFLRNGLQAPYTGLRLKVEDADALRAFYLVEPPDSLALSTNTPKPEQLQAEAVQHTTKGQRRDILKPVIEHAQSLCKHPMDTAEVWGQLHKLAGVQYLVLLHVEGKTIAYTDGDDTKFLTRKHLAERLKRQQGRPARQGALTLAKAL